MEFLFTNDSHPSRTDEIIEYLMGPRLWIPSTDYPDAINWLQRSHGEINAGTKRAMVAYHERRVAGVVIYQRDILTLRSHPNFIQPNFFTPADQDRVQVLNLSEARVSGLTELFQNFVNKYNQKANYLKLVSPAITFNIVTNVIFIILYIFANEQLTFMNSSIIGVVSIVLFAFFYRKSISKTINFNFPL